MVNENISRAEFEQLKDQFDDLLEAHNKLCRELDEIGLKKQIDLKLLL